MGEGIGQGAVLMNHYDDLVVLELALKIVLSKYEAEITAIKDHKHRTELIQEFDKARHYMHKMAKYLNDMNCWFTAFGVDGDGCKHS